MNYEDDKVKPQEKDTGFMSALLNSGIIRATFVGHSHGNLLYSLCIL